MTEAAIYLATAPKSNTAVTTYAAAKADVDAHGALPVPAHLRNASSGMGKALGWGAGYQYPHDFKGHHVREEYLPEELRGHHYYEPSDSGDEREIAARQAAAARRVATKRATRRNRTDGMPSYVAMLRGINVSGSKPVKMDALRASFEALGFKNVRTYVQSGNVVFEAKERAAAPLGPEDRRADQARLRVRRAGAGARRRRARPGGRGEPVPQAAWAGARPDASCTSLFSPARRRPPG